ncbi:hypothetical protein EV363DRAFT_1560376 [Boletus edulis]|nr:hypothetical protein EV363DRAFT_1560376 [Boletus edulis]
MLDSRVHRPFFPHSQSTPYMSSTTGHDYTATGYGTSTGYGSHPSSLASSTISSTSSILEPLSSSSLLAPRATTSRNDTQLSPSDFASTFSNTFAEARSATSSPAISPTVSPLRRPQTSPRSPLASVRNIVPAWKERTPALGKAKSSTESSVSPVIKLDGMFGLCRCASRVERGQQHASENTGDGHNPPTTPQSVNSNIIPPPFDMAELGAYARDSREPLRKGDLWYLNVHSGPPYCWQRCEALLYPHMLLLSWIAPAGGRGGVMLDLLNCTEVRSVPSPSHPSAKEDVGTIAARAQIAEGSCPPLMELLCPFQLLYSNGVERLAAESARQRTRWVGAIWDALDHSVTLPSRSEPGSPTGSIGTIRTMTMTTSASGSGFNCVCPTPAHDSQPVRPAHVLGLIKHRAVSSQSYIYPGDPRVIAPSRSSSLRRTSSLTDLDEEFASAENAGSGYTASQSRSTLSSWMRSHSTTPTSTPSTATLSALEILDGSGSEGYETANSPLTASFKSLLSIPSETDYTTVKQCKTEVSTEFHTADCCQCASDVLSEYVIADKCKTEASTKFYTAKKCKLETETEFVTVALCECERTEQSDTHYETASLCKTIPSEASTPRSLAVNLPVEKAPTPPPKTPMEVPSLQSPESDIHPELPPKSVPLPPSETSPTISSASRDLESEHIEETPAPPPLIVSSGELSMSLPMTIESSSEEESSRMPTVSSTESSEFVMSDLPVSEVSLPSPAPLATTESSPSIHPSQWAPETDISYESLQLQPTPLTQSLQIQDECDISFETSIMRPSVSPLSSFGSLTAITETITTSAALTPPPPPPPPPPLPATVIQTVISPSSGLTPLALTSMASLSLSRTPSSVSSISSLSKVSTEPSLLSSLHSSSISSVHYSPQPTRVPSPEISLSDHSPAPSPSVSSNTLQTNQPSIYSVLETVQTQTHTERTEVITHEIDRLLHHIHKLDHLRSQERHEISKNIRMIRDELYDLSEYVRTHLIETKELVIPERPEAPAVSHRDQSVVAISERRDQSIAAISVVSEPRITPIEPRSRHLIPIPLTPPPVRSPSTRSMSSLISLISFLSSHHLDDFSLLDVDEVEVEMHPPSPAWPSEPSSPSSGLTPSIISSSEPSPGPTLSLTSSSSSPTPPPLSPTISTGLTTSSDSSVTAQQVPGITLTTI